MPKVRLAVHTQVVSFLCMILLDTPQPPVE